MRFYTAGYAGQSPEALNRIAGDLDAVVIDIRYNPVSRDPRWSFGALSAAVGVRYKHVPAWGNPNHHTGRTCAIADYIGGLSDMTTWSRLWLKENAILLCGCSDPETCHRTLLAQKLAAAGHEVSELVWTPAPGTIKALSVRQPWAWLIIHAGKDIENRSEASARNMGEYRGPLAIHAAKGMTRTEYQDACLWVHYKFGPETCLTIPIMSDLPRGGLIGMVDLGERVTESKSPLVHRPGRAVPVQSAAHPVRTHARRAWPVRCRAAGRSPAMTALPPSVAFVLDYYRRHPEPFALTAIVLAIICMRAWYMVGLHTRRVERMTTPDDPLTEVRPLRQVRRASRRASHAARSRHVASLPRVPSVRRGRHGADTRHEGRARINRRPLQRARRFPRIRSRGHNRRLRRVVPGGRSCQLPRAEWLPPQQPGR